MPSSSFLRHCINTSQRDRPPVRCSHMCLDSEDVYRSTAHATCSCDGRQEGGECRNGYSLYYFPDFTFHSLIVSLNSSILQFSIFNFQFSLGLRSWCRLAICHRGSDRNETCDRLILAIDVDSLRRDDVAILQ